MTVFEFNRSASLLQRLQRFVFRRWSQKDLFFLVNQGNNQETSESSLDDSTSIPAHCLPINLPNPIGYQGLKSTPIMQQVNHAFLKKHPAKKP